MTAHEVQKPVFSILSGAECDAVLSRNHIGHLAFTNAGRVDIEPVSYVAAISWLFMRSVGARSSRRLRIRRMLPSRSMRRRAHYLRGSRRFETTTKRQLFNNAHCSQLLNCPNKQTTIGPRCRVARDVLRPVEQWALHQGRHSAAHRHLLRRSDRRVARRYDPRGRREQVAQVRRHQ